MLPRFYIREADISEEDFAWGGKRRVTVSWKNTISSIGLVPFAFHPVAEITCITRKLILDMRLDPDNGDTRVILQTKLGEVEVPAYRNVRLVVDGIMFRPEIVAMTPGNRNFLGQDVLHHFRVSVDRESGNSTLELV